MNVPFGKYKGRDVLAIQYDKRYANWMWEKCRITIHHYPEFEEWIKDYFGFWDDEWTDEMQTEYLKKYNPTEYELLESLKTYVYIVINNYSESNEIVDVYLDYDLMMKETEWWRTHKEGHIRTAWYIDKREAKL